MRRLLSCKALFITPTFAWKINPHHLVMCRLEQEICPNRRDRHTNRQFSWSSRITCILTLIWPVWWVSSLSAAARVSRSPRGVWAPRSRSGGGRYVPAAPAPSWCCHASSTWPACSGTRPGNKRRGVIYAIFWEISSQSIESITVKFSLALLCAGLIVSNSCGMHFLWGKNSMIYRNFVKLKPCFSAGVTAPVLITK